MGDRAGGTEGGERGVRTFESLATESAVSPFSAVGSGSHGWLLLERSETAERYTVLSEMPREAARRRRWLRLVERARARVESAPTYPDHLDSVAELQAMTPGLSEIQGRSLTAD